jgi:anti-sigma28 factor (negative regulator of flagellin synthesis)
LRPDRAARIRELKQQIAEGTYQPDPQAIAREILKRGL